ncbi:MAG: hypothetical protein H6Q77_494 [Gemmatimonadetes bacterium]|jgi:hypothetical protein|nr:hypothetical protein [Gemmatimonadota bacterium]
MGVKYLLVPLALLVPAALSAQQAGITGTWVAKVKTKDGPQKVIIRSDSSASWGNETVRWRWPTPTEIRILLGGEWEVYTIDLKGDKMKLSGAELDEPVTLKRVGPPSARPDSVKIPSDPDS